MNFKIIVLAIAANCIISWMGMAQNLPLSPIKNYFAFPIMPGEQNSLTGNMGELRSNHFHGGLDIRTKYQTGLPVYAAADGYIKKVNIDSQGYGWMLTIKHPNGYQTLYAHLQDFVLPLAKAVKAKQYERETFQIEVNFSPKEFPVKRGELIAYSGNTGSSAGPHLHWEIKDSTEGAYNNLLFGFKEVMDNKAPYFVRVAFRPLSTDARINQAFERVEYAPVKSGNNYVINKAIPVYGTLGAEIWAHDRLNNGSQRAGVMITKVILDKKLIFEHSTAHLSQKQLKQVNHHLVYDVYRMKGERHYKAYYDEGNHLRAQFPTDKIGLIAIRDTNLHDLEIFLQDAYGNTSTCFIKLKGQKSISKKMLPEIVDGAKPRFSYSQIGNILSVKVSNLAHSDSILLLQKAKHKVFLNRAFVEEGRAVFLYDSRKGAIDTAIIKGVETAFSPFDVIIYPSLKQHIDGAFSRIQFEQNSLFDTAFIQFKEDTFKQELTVGSPLIAFQGIATVSFKIPPFEEEKYLGIYQILNEKGSAKWIGNFIQGGEMRGRIKYFGKYKLLSDSRPPTFKVIRQNKSGFTVRIADNLSGINSWRCTVNGKWLLLNYEHKQNMLTSSKLDANQDLNGELIFELKDNAGNVAYYKTNIK